MTGHVALVPGVLALLPEYASLDDPVAELRAACRQAVRAALGAEAADSTGGEGGFEGRKPPIRRVRVVAGSESGMRVGRHLVEEAGGTVIRDGDADGADADAVVVVGNGSAKRTEKAPGHLDERAEAFDAALREALVAADPDALRRIDQGLAAELWADVRGLVRLGEVLNPGQRAEVVFDAAPFGVQYWVVCWST